jgi:hypothetical protein
MTNEIMHVIEAGSSQLVKCSVVNAVTIPPPHTNSLKYLFSSFACPIFFFFFFCGTGVEPWALCLVGLLYPVSQTPSPFCCTYFSDRVLYFCLRLPSHCDPFTCLLCS